MGVAAGVLGGAEFGAVIAMVVATTFVTPPWLGVIAGAPPNGHGDGDSGSGLSELVAEGAPSAPMKRATQARPKFN
jgi:hypothetical protein